MEGRPVLNSTGYQALILSIWGALVLGILVSLRWFALRRHTQPIKGRGTWSVITVQIICLILVSFDAIQYLLPPSGYPSGYPCAINFWYTVACVALFGSVYVARCWKLYFNIKLADEISSGQMPHSTRLQRTPPLKGRHVETRDETAVMDTRRAELPDGETGNNPVPLTTLRAYTPNPESKLREDRDKNRNSLSTQPEEEAEHADSPNQGRDNLNSTSASNSPSSSLADASAAGAAPAISIIPPESDEFGASSHSRQPSLIGGRDMMQQNLLNMALSLYGAIPDAPGNHSRTNSISCNVTVTTTTNNNNNNNTNNAVSITNNNETSRDTHTPSPPPESFHLRIPSNPLSLPYPASPSSTHSDNDEARLLASSPLPLSPSSSTALIESSPATEHADTHPIAINLNNGGNSNVLTIPVFALPPHVEEEDPSHLDSTASSNKTSPRLKPGLMVSETVPSRRSQVFASYDNGTFSRVSHGATDLKDTAPADAVGEEAVGEPDVTEYAAGGWFMEHRFMNSNAFMVLIVAIGAGVALVPAAYIFTNTTVEINATGGCVTGPRTVYIGVLIVFYLIVIFPMFLFFVPRTDGFSIIRELALTVSGVLVGVVMAGLSRSRILNSWVDEVFPLDDLAMMVIAAAFWIPSIIYPIYRSYVLEENIVKETRSGESLDYVPLSVLLEDAEGLELFASHLQAEFSLENLVFWECVEDFRSMTAEISDPTTRYRLALRVFDSCIRARSMFEVNLPAMIRKNIIEDLFPNGRTAALKAQSNLGTPLTPRQSSDREFSQRNLGPSSIEMSRIVQVNAGAAAIDAGFFDAAQHSIFQLMNSDSFVRFRHTPAYKDYVKRYKSRESQGLLHNIQSLFTETGAPSDDLLAFRRQRSSSARASWSRDNNLNGPLFPASGGGSNLNNYTLHAPGGYNNTSLSRASASGFRPSLNEVIRPEMSAHRNLTGSISSGRISLLHNVPAQPPSRSWEHPAGHPSA